MTIFHDLRTYRLSIYAVFVLLILSSCQKSNVSSGPVPGTPRTSARDVSPKPVLMLSASYSPSSLTINVQAQLIWPNGEPSDAALYKIEVKTNRQDIGPGLSTSFNFNAPQLGSLPITVQITGTVYSPGGSSVASASIDLIIYPDGTTGTVNLGEILEFESPTNPAPYNKIYFNNVVSNYYGSLKIYAFYFPEPTPQDAHPSSIFLGKVEFATWSFGGLSISFNAPLSYFSCDLQHIRLFATKKDYPIEYFTYLLRSMPTKHLIDLCYFDAYYYGPLKGIGNSQLYTYTGGKNRTQIGFLDPMLDAQIPYFQASKDLYPFY